MGTEVFKNILVVDDEENMRHVLGFLLGKEGYEVAGAASGEEALDALAKEPFHLMIADVRMEGMDGVELLKRAKARYPGLTVIMMSAYGTIDSAMDAIRLGAYDYVPKPFRAEEVVLAVRKAEERQRLLEENRQLREAVSGTYSFEGMVGKSRALRRVIDTVRRVAEVNTTVLITGESATGKELVAKAIHYTGPRAAEPLVAINCAGLPETLLESELFGHVKGAFTDAFRDKPGLITRASRGTFFLDEVGEMPISVQAKLLRVLEDQKVRPVGGTEETEVEVRFIAATAKDLGDEVDAGRFRQDLFWRLNVINLNLPPLRERMEDLRVLVVHFVEKYSKELKKGVQAVSPLALGIMERYDYPGNVRELENIVERAVVMARGELIEPGDLPAHLNPRARDQGPKERAASLSLKHAVMRLEEDHIREALKRTGNNRLQASKILGISHPTLLSKIKKYGIKT